MWRVCGVKMLAADLQICRNKLLLDSFNLTNLIWLSNYGVTSNKYCS